jgi:carbonic anhydrase
MRKLIEGIVEFREKKLPDYVARFRALAAGQSPDALFVTCSDSRVVPDLLASTNPGDLFIMRNVGNLMPPATVDGMSTGDVSEASAIEYSVLVLKVPTIVVCGHAGCGAMKAALKGSAVEGAPNIGRWLHHANPALVRLRQEGPLNPALPLHDQLSQLNVLVQIEHLMSYAIVRERVLAGTLQLAGWWFDVASGDMYSYERDSRSFQLIERELAARMSARFRS